MALRAEDDTLRVSVVGVLRAWRGGIEIALGRPKQRALLGMLAMHAGRAVGRDRIIDGIWGDDPPLSAVNGVHVYVGELRRAFEPGLLARSAGRFLVSGDHDYLLRADPSYVDAIVLVDLLRNARRARAGGDLDQAIRTFDDALELCQGTAWEGIPGPFAEVERARIGELYIAGMEDRAEAHLAADSPSEVVASLSALIPMHPMRERLRSLTMLALYRAGRQGEAFAVYRSVRTILAEELGVDPSQDLQHLHAMMIAADPALDLAVPSLAPRQARERAKVTDARFATPRQLPRAVRHLVGRQHELATLADLARQASEPDCCGVVAVIDGTAGVGKTALAVTFAHRVAERFPDGQLYADLRGFDPIAEPISPWHAIRRFLLELAVDPAQIPADTDSMIGLYRSVLAGRRTLLVLDNARGEAQVRPLLPGAAGSLVIITSRGRLTGLIADGASLLTLDILPTPEAAALLARRLAAYPTPVDADSASELARLCAGLPLALTVVAARAAESSRLPLAGLAAELRTARNRLDALDSGEPSTSVRCVLSWSYASLTASAARMFRLLGVHPGPDISVPAAASLASVPAKQARAAITELQRAHLLTEPAPGRYAFHDLLRAYAAERADADEPGSVIQAAIGRTLDHYLHSAYAAALALNPARKPITLPQPSPGCTPERFTSHDQASAWFSAEHQILVTAAAEAARTGRDAHAWQFAWSLTEHLDRCGRWHEWAELWQAGLDAARRLADPSACARADVSLARAYIRLSRHDEARTHLLQALDIYAGITEPIAHAQAYLNLAWLCDQQGHPGEALSHARAARELYQAVGDQHGEADSLNASGWYHRQLGDARSAVRACQHAVALLHELDDHLGESMAWDSLGRAHHQLGHYDDAVTCYQQALLLRTRIGDRYNLAATLIRLGDTYQASGLFTRARDAWQQALAILEQLNHHDADQVRAKLDQLVASDEAVGPAG